jgi:hypothetical protein
VRTDWDVKALHKLIVTSATYRQSSRLTPALRTRSRQSLAGPWSTPPAAGACCDQALAVSGLLVEKVGGPPVKPYQPPGIWEEMTFGQIKYRQDKGDNLYRRSVYSFWRRTVGPTTMFDTSARQQCTVRASRTNTPARAAAAERDNLRRGGAEAGGAMLKEPGTAEERVAAMFRLTTARRPTDAERAILTKRGAFAEPVWGQPRGSVEAGDGGRVTARREA